MLSGLVQNRFHHYLKRIAGVFALMDCLLGNYMSNRISAFQKLFVHLFADLVLSSRAHLILIFDLLWPAYWKNGPHDAGAEKIIILIFSSKYFLYFFGETTICICAQLLRNFWSNSMTFQIWYICHLFYHTTIEWAFFLSNYCWNIRKGSLLVV